MSGPLPFWHSAIVSGIALCSIFYLDSLNPAAARSPACSPDIYDEVRSEATRRSATVEIDCDLTLSADDVITKRIVFSGEGASGASLDCQGATLDGGRGTLNSGKPMIFIRSLAPRRGEAKTGAWSAPSGISVRNCTIKGAIRLQGLGTNGQAKEVQRSSLNPDHTAHAQASAPSDITLSELKFIADGRVPLYLGPGVTGVRVEASTFTGESNGPALYLDAESAGNTITANTFAVASKREQIAIDGSANNTISGNRFDDVGSGGVFLYRNCGEGGTIRHQKPQHNVISGNTFRYRGMAFLAKPAVWLNSRGGTQRYCFRDPDHPYGSSLSSQDFAQFNTVTGNRLIGGGQSMIRNADPSNVISDNGK